VDRRTAGLMLIVVLLGLTAACGGRVSQAELSKALRAGQTVTAFGGSIKVKYDAKQAKCVAKVLHASGLSDEALGQIVNPEQDKRASRADIEALDIAGAKLQACDPQTPNVLVPRPSVAVLTSGFENGLRGYPFGSKVLAQAEGAQAECLAKTLHDSKISNLSLAVLLAQTEAYQAPEADLAAFKARADDLGDCLDPAK